MINQQSDKSTGKQQTDNSTKNLLLEVTDNQPAAALQKDKTNRPSKKYSYIREPSIFSSDCWKNPCHIQIAANKNSSYGEFDFFMRY